MRGHASEFEQASGSRKRVAFVGFFCVAMFCLIGATFYIQDYRYSLPTPRPPGFVPVGRDALISLPHPDGRPTLLCFASPDCPCSRFNQDHLWDLSQHFGASVRFIEVIEGKTAGGLKSPGESIVDPDGAWAKKCGVYSTPQAVILDADERISFSGNFNSSRFCADPSSQFARIALEAVVAHHPVPPMPNHALTPYGCAFASPEKFR